MSIAATQDFSYMGDPQLKQALQFAQRANDTMKFLGIKAEIDKREKTRNAAQGQQAEQQLASEGPRTEADKIMAGIANLSSGDHEYANGGIVAFAGGDLVRDSAGNPLLPEEERRQRLKERLAAEAAQQVSPGQAMSRLRDTIRNAMGLYTDAAPAAPAPTTATAMPAAAPAAAAPRVEPQDRDYINPQAYRDFQGAQQQPPAPPAGPRRAPAAAPGIAALAQPAAPAVPEKPILSAAEQMAADEAMAKGRNDKVAAIYAKADERDAKRRAELDKETGGSEGLFGLSRDKNMAARDFFLNMAASKEPTVLGAAGEAAKTTSANYKTEEARRAARRDLLDDAEEKRQMAKMAAEQGNMELANKYGKQEADLREKAAGRAFEERKLASTEGHQRDVLKLGYAGLDNAIKVAKTRASAGISGLTGKADLGYLTAAQKTVDSQLKAMQQDNSQYTNPEKYAELQDQLRQIQGAMLAHTTTGTMAGASSAGGKTGNPLVDKYLAK